MTTVSKDINKEIHKMETIQWNLNNDKDTFQATITDIPQVGNSEEIGYHDENNYIPTISSSSCLRHRSCTSGGRAA